MQRQERPLARRGPGAGHCAGESAPAHTAAGNYRNYPNNVERCTTSLLPVVFTSILLDINIECIKYFSSNKIIILGGGHMEPEVGQSIDQSEMMSPVVT